MKHKKIIVGGLMTVTLLGTGAYGLHASAATNTTPGETLASKIAEKFNLNKDEVKQVIDENRAEHRAEHQAKMLERAEARLSKAVTNGKITEDQKTKILDYLKSQQSFFDSLQDKTEEERKTALEQHRQDMKQWAQDNGIDEQYVMMGGPGGPHGHHGMHSDMDSDDGSNTP